MAAGIVSVAKLGRVTIETAVDVEVTGRMLTLPVSAGAAVMIVVLVTTATSTHGALSEVAALGIAAGIAIVKGIMAAIPMMKSAVVD